MSKGLTLSNDRVIKLENNEPPRLVNWTKNKNLNISENGTELSSPGYYYYWGTARSSVTVFRGSWYFEVTIKSRNSCRIGWCTTKFYPESDSSPLGTDDNSWAVDGSQQKKYHKSTDGVKFGDYWNRGDIIGCLLDFDQRRIVYYKNGSQLGVAFSNVRSDTGLIPAISVSYDTKVIVNFGREVKHLPPGSFHMNPTVTPQQKKDMEDVFEKYKLIGQETNSDYEDDSIKGAGTLSLAQDLGSTGPMDPLIVILAWKLRSHIQWSFERDEWNTTWALQGASTFDEMKDAIQLWKKEMEDDETVFGNFYGFVFDYLKQEEKSTALEKTEALMAWKMVGVDTKWVLFPQWEQWWKENSLKGVAKDTWTMLLRFIKLGTNFNNYDENDCWPTAIDDFVQEALKK